MDIITFLGLFYGIWKTVIDFFRENREYAESLPSALFWWLAVIIATSFIVAYKLRNSFRKARQTSVANDSACTIFVLCKTTSEEIPEDLNGIDQALQNGFCQINPKETKKITLTHSTLSFYVTVLVRAQNGRFRLPYVNHPVNYYGDLSITSSGILELKKSEQQGFWWYFDWMWRFLSRTGKKIEIRNESDKNILISCEFRRAQTNSILLSAEQWRRKNASLIPNGGSLVFEPEKNTVDQNSEEKNRTQALTLFFFTAYSDAHEKESPTMLFSNRSIDSSCALAVFRNGDLVARDLHEIGTPVMQLASNESGSGNSESSAHEQEKPILIEIDEATLPEIYTRTKCLWRLFGEESKTTISEELKQSVEVWKALNERCIGCSCDYKQADLQKLAEDIIKVSKDQKSHCDFEERVLKPIIKELEALLEILEPNKAEN